MPPHYSDEFKKKIISSFQTGSSVQDLEKKYKIPSSTIYRWVKGCQRCLTVQGQNFNTSDISKLVNEVERLRKENEILHMAKCSVQAPLSEKIPEMIRIKEETDCDVHTLCRAFEVLRSTYYHRVLRSPTKTQLEQEDDKYKAIIKEIFDDSKGRFGSMMIRAKMKEQGYQISQNRILRLMREMDIQCNRSKGTLAEYKQAYHPRVYTTGNKLNRQFKQTEPNRVWVSDITYLRTLNGVCYLCVIIDLFSHRVVGHTLSHFQDVRIVIATVKKAFNSRGRPANVMLHSDQGRQYTSFDLELLLSRLNIEQSFSEAGVPYDNAVAESFFGCMKREELYRHVFKDINELAPVVDEYIQFYNEQRPHQALGMMTPCKFEESILQFQKQ